MSPLKIRLLLELYASARPDLEFPAGQWFAPAMRMAFSDFRLAGLIQPGVQQDADWGAVNEALTPAGYALVKRLKEINP